MLSGCHDARQCTPVFGIPYYSFLGGKAVFESPIKCKCYVKEREKKNLFSVIGKYIHISLSKWGMKLRREWHGVTDEERKGCLAWFRSQNLDKELQ